MPVPLLSGGCPAQPPTFLMQSAAPADCRETAAKWQHYSDRLHEEASRLAGLADGAKATAQALRLAAYVLEQGQTLDDAAETLRSMEMVTSHGRPSTADRLEKAMKAAKTLIDSLNAFYTLIRGQEGAEDDM